MLPGDILIVGGYGAVGRIIALGLADKFPGQVVVAGRSLARAEALARASNDRVRPRQLDLAVAHQDPDLLDQVGVVVMCLDVPDMQFVRQVLQKGIHYIDITAEDGLLQQIEALDGVAREHGSTAILSVGLAPGLTNLLARYGYSQFDTAQQVAIHIMLGLGDAHGVAATRWTLQNLNANYIIRENGRRRQTGSFRESKVVDFPAGIGRRRVYRFNLPDQHVLARSLDIPSVSTWLALDPALMSTVMSFIRRSGLATLFRYRPVTDAVVRLSSALKHGSDLFAGQIEIKGEFDGQPQTLSLTGYGHGQSHGTALVAIQVVEQLVTGDRPAGVFHIGQLFAPLPFLRQLSGAGIVFTSSDARVAVPA